MADQQPSRFAAALPWVSAIAPIAGGVISNILDNRRAKQQAKWNEQQQANQRQYDLEQWHRVNQYNSPQAQMARFSQAGLSPHLIYGQGTAGNASAMRSPDVKPYSRSQSRNVLEGMDVFGKHLQFKNLEAQTDNLKAGTNVKDMEALLKGAQELGQTIANNRSRLSYEQEKILFGTQIDAQRTALQIMSAELKQKRTQGSILEVEKKYAEKTAKARLRNLSLDGDIKGLVKEIKALEAETGGTTTTHRIIYELIQEGGLSGAVVNHLEEKGVIGKGEGTYLRAFTPF